MPNHTLRQCFAENVHQRIVVLAIGPGAAGTRRTVGTVVIRTACARLRHPAERRLVRGRRRTGASVFDDIYIVISLREYIFNVGLT